jgi:RNA polymerase sigma factor (sigma-70 family)
MSRSLLQLVVRQLGELTSAPARSTDAELVRTLAADRKAGRPGDAPFAELVRRHGPMVWAVCRQSLPDPADAEDAFQATFLVLVRSAGAVRDPAAVGGWLHGVAVRVARDLRLSAARRRRREQKAARPEPDRPVPDAAWDALLVAVHEEVDRLPGPLRTAFVLCDLQGVRQPDAAERLGWKPGTLTGRLARARRLLLDRLTGRGLAPAVAAGGVGVGAAAAAAAVPPGLTNRAMSLAAGGEAGPTILRLVSGVTPMTLNRTKLFAAALLATAGLAVGLGSAVLSHAGAQDTGGSADVGQPPAGAPSGPALPNPTAGSSDAFQPGPATGGAGYPGPGGPRGGVTGFQPGVPGGGPPGGFQPGWEYMVVEKPATPKEFVDLLTKYGKSGWEFCGEVSGFRTGGSGPGAGVNTGPQLVFKRASRPAPGPGGPGDLPAGGGPMPGGPPGGLPGGPGAGGAPALRPAAGSRGVRGVPTSGVAAGPPAGAVIPAAPAVPAPGASGRATAAARAPEPPAAPAS